MHRSAGEANSSSGSRSTQKFVRSRVGSAESAAANSEARALMGGGAICATDLAKPRKWGKSKSIARGHLSLELKISLVLAESCKQSKTCCWWKASRAYKLRISEALGWASARSC